MNNSHSEKIETLEKKLEELYQDLEHYYEMKPTDSEHAQYIDEVIKHLNKKVTEQKKRIRNAKDLIKKIKTDKPEQKKESDISKEDLALSTKKGILRAHNQILFQHYYDEIYEKLEEGEVPDLLKDQPQEVIESLRKRAVMKKAKEGKHYYSFVTINPHMDVDIEQFLAKLEHFFSRTGYVDREWYYVIEQRAKEEEEDMYGQGMHCHMLIYSEDINPSRLKSHLESSFRTLVGNKKHICIQPRTKEGGKVTIKYILGYKKDPTGVKQSKVRADTHWRIENEIEHLYYNHDAVDSDLGPLTHYSETEWSDGDDNEDVVKTSEDEDKGKEPEIEEEEVDYGETPKEYYFDEDNHLREVNPEGFYYGNIEKRGRFVECNGQLCKVEDNVQDLILSEERAEEINTQA